MSQTGGRRGLGLASAVGMGAGVSEAIFALPRPPRLKFERRRKPLIVLSLLAIATSWFLPYVFFALVQFCEPSSVLFHDLASFTGHGATCGVNHAGSWIEYDYFGSIHADFHELVRCISH